MLFQPPPAADRPQPPDLVEVVWLDTSAGRVELWWLAMVDAYDWAVRQQAVDASRVVAHGRSVGGGAALLLAEQRPVAALVLESTFTSVVDIARSKGVPALLIRDPFNNQARIASYEGPVLLLHGARDSQIPPDHSRRLREAAGGTATLELLPCGHNDCPTAWPHVLPFLRAHGILQNHAVGGH